MNQGTQAPAQTGPELPGMTCLGLLGSGGFADVYLYERHHPRVRVAVKLMRSAEITDAQRAQFTAEADVMAELAEHPFIVPVLGAGSTPDGRPYLVMRHYPRADLAARVRRNPMSVPEALKLGIQMASAVETAHRAGIIHRDIKPSNILQTQYGVPGLADFGIAGRPADDEGEIGVSLPWSPPEVLTAASKGSVASDVYSLAATVWTLLVGHSPFAERGNNSDRAIVARILHNPPPATGRPDVPVSLDRLLQQAMAKDPVYRPASALELARHFQRIEQELRLARTEVQVLDREAGPTGSFAAVPAVAGDAPDTGSGRSDLTQPSATVAPPPPPPAAVDPEALKPTEFKPPTQVVAQAPQWSRPSASAAAERPTQFHLPPSAPAAPPAEPVGERRPRRTFTLAGVAVLVVAAAAVGIALTRGSDKPQQHTPPPPVDTDLPGVSGPPAPVRLTGHRQGRRAVFTWQPVQGATGYQWVADNGTRGTAARPSVTIPMKKAHRLCLQVRTLAGSTGSQGATTACLTRR